MMIILGFVSLFAAILLLIMTSVGPYDKGLKYTEWMFWLLGLVFVIGGMF